ncbi:hypothetical protein IU436_26595 [Nocardia farcinica]|uniref:hypothetical protein n=1 Tax=Nocardia TaxID=1817 RepID=UPI00189417EE|nr:MULTISPECIES: hypothetical protein [Nocardia]MBF6290039.1 hypothetical protein [Nocardia cyriacigeorgica]MBF6422260.1 hypothetical protein [Nocardia farcinica]MBF6433916.1 hypothetical protein [Nocardia farcinica]MBF6504984.1 hypothetical protein [Nocardia farcinica]
MNEEDDSFEALLSRRLHHQGPDHPDTRHTMANLIQGKTRDLTSVDREAADLPGEAPSASQIRLDRDGVDDEIDLVEYALALHEHLAAVYGNEDPRTLVGRSYLAYALAFANHLDAQLESAEALAQDAYEGLADATEAGKARPRDARTAELIYRWIDDRVNRPE